MSPATIWVFTAASAALIFGARDERPGGAGPGAAAVGKQASRRRPPRCRSNRPNQSKGGASSARRGASGASFVLQRDGRPRRRGSRRPPRAAQPLEAGAHLVRVARLDDLAGPGEERRPPARPGVVEQDERARSALPCARRRAHVAARQERSLGLQRLRPLQDRGRPIQLAHDGTDDGRLPLCRGLREKACSSGREGRGRPLRIARPDRQGPRHRPRHPARPVGRAARPDRPGRGRRDRRRASAKPAGSASAARARSASTKRRPALPPARAAAAPFERHALRRLRRGRRASWTARIYYSVGGGAVVDEAAVARNAPPEGAWDMPHQLQLGRSSCSPSPSARG